MYREADNFTAATSGSGILWIMPRLSARFEIDADLLNGYVSIMKRTLGDYIAIGLLVLVMSTTAAGMVIRIYLAVTGG